MAIRNIRQIGDEVLTKKCKEVTQMTERTRELIEDMLETMYEANGVGLAAPQVGILKRIVVIDVTGEDPHVLINPRIVETDGEQTGPEELEGTELLARAICHELEHLDGHLYVERVEGPLQDVTAEDEEDGDTEE